MAQASTQIVETPVKESLAREYGMDTLRTVAALMVIALHCSASYFAANTSHMRSPDFIESDILESMLRVCVPLFVMISGRFLLEKQSSAAAFYSRKMLRLIKLTAFWSAVYIAFKCAGILIQGMALDLPKIFTDLISGVPYYHLWYLFMLLGIYAVTPPLQKALRAIPERWHFWLAAGLMLFGMGLEYVDMILKNHPPFVLWFLKYIGFYLMGWVLRKRTGIPAVVLLGGYLLCSAAVAVLTAYTIRYFHYNIYFFSYASPFVGTGAVLLYLFFSETVQRENVFSRWARYSFGLYLIHPILLAILEIAGIFTGSNAIFGIAAKTLLLVTITLPLAKLALRIPVLKDMV